MTDLDDLAKRLPEILQTEASQTVPRSGLAEAVARGTARQRRARLARSVAAVLSVGGLVVGFVLFDAPREEPPPSIAADGLSIGEGAEGLADEPRGDPSASQDSGGGVGGFNDDFDLDACLAADATAPYPAEPIAGKEIGWIRFDDPSVLFAAVASAEPSEKFPGVFEVVDLAGASAIQPGAAHFQTARQVFLTAETIELLRAVSHDEWDFAVFAYVATSESAQTELPTLDTGYVKYGVLVGDTHVEGLSSSQRPCTAAAGILASAKLAVSPAQPRDPIALLKDFANRILDPEVVARLGG